MSTTEDTGASLDPGPTTYVADHHRDPGAGPDPDADIKPGSPVKLTKRSWRYVGKKTLGEFLEDQCTDIAASLTYYAVLALFPGLIALTSVLGLIGQSGQAVDTILQVLRPLVSSGVYSTLEDALSAMASSNAAGFALALGLLGAVFSASGYVNAFSRAMNRIYEVQEGRPIYKLRPQMMLVTLVALLLAASVLVMLIVSGPLAESIGGQIGRTVGLESQTVSTATLIWAIAKWPVVFVFVVVIVALLYYATPNVQQPKFRWISVGAALAILIWVLASVAFAFYVSNFGSYDKTYGSLAGVIVFLLWLWITNLALLLGAELDSELERGRELQAGIPAEEELRLPARDTSGIVKSQEKEEKMLERGRAIREDADPDGSVAATYGVIESGSLVTAGTLADRRRGGDAAESQESVEVTEQDAGQDAEQDAGQDAVDDLGATSQVDEPGDEPGHEPHHPAPVEPTHPTTVTPVRQQPTDSGTRADDMDATQKALLVAGVGGAAVLALRGVRGVVRAIRG